MNQLSKISILGVGVTDAKEREVLEFIVTGLQNFTEKYYIVTPNPELLVIANDNKQYKDILNGAKLALPDGIGVIIGGWLVGKRFSERITGVDLVKNLSKYVSKRPITVGFLGAGPNVAVKTAECLKQLYPDLKVGLVSEEWNKALENNKIDILFVAFGSPKQEIFIYENLQKLPAKIIVGVGGAFDFISGKTRRAPKFLRDLGLEWLFRLVLEPWRLKRQTALIKFLYLIFKERLTKI